MHNGKLQNGKLQDGKRQNGKIHNGMLTVYKEAGYTSSDAVARLRGILRMRKIGHTGTLDPDAEGVLPMCLGNATRICELIADREKEYVAVMRLGVRTDTQDMSGTVLSRIDGNELLNILCGTVFSEKESSQTHSSEKEDPGIVKKDESCIQTDSASNPLTVTKEVAEDMTDDTAEAVAEDVTDDAAEAVAEDATDVAPEALAADEKDILKAEEKIRAAASRFVGEIDQIPPMYSAVKINGKRLYDLARKGKTVERQARCITIHSLEIEKIELPLVTMRVRCSKGTYIRTLCEDIGNALGTGAAMQSLLRTRVGKFTLEEARTLDEIERIAKTEPEETLQALVQPVDSFFADLPAASCAGESLRLLKNGNPLGEKDLHFLFGKEDPRTPPEEIAGTTLPAFDDTVAPLLPGAGPEDSVIRVYDENGQFYGLYRRAKGRKHYSAFKMFLPEDT